MSYIEGIGDEVLLFFTFIVASSGILLFLVLRESYRRAANSSERSNDAAVTDLPASSSNDELLAPNQGESRDEFRQDTPLSDPNNVNQTEPVNSFNIPEAQPEEVQTNNVQPEDLPIAVRLVLQDRTINAEFLYATTLREVKSQYFQDQLVAGRRVRFICHGRVFEDDNTTLQECGVTNNSAIHVHVSEYHNAPDQVQNGELDLSRMFVPLLGVILGICWAALISKPIFFTFFTKCLLYMLSLLWVVITFNTYTNTQSTAQR